MPRGAEATAAAKLDIDAANLEALEREIRAARALSGGRGLLAINHEYTDDGLLHPRHFRLNAAGKAAYDTPAEAEAVVDMMRGRPPAPLAGSHLAACVRNQQPQ